MTRKQKLVFLIVVASLSTVLGVVLSLLLDPVGITLCILGLLLFWMAYKFKHDPEYFEHPAPKSDKERREEERREPDTERRRES